MLMHLMESMEDQECKEMILSYCVLSANGKSMTLKEIDTKCEMLLHKRFGLSVDFDVEGAVVEGLVEQRAGVLYTATPLRKALQRLDTKWDNLFSYTDDGGAAMQSSLVMQEETARKVRYQTVEAELARSLSKTDVERAAVVGKLREQQDEITERIKVLESAMTSYKWRTG
jgi:NDP-sugar pyrophosphorylase family protein